MLLCLPRTRFQVNMRPLPQGIASSQAAIDHNLLLFKIAQDRFKLTP